ncbi:MAG TPA: DNA repair protein RecO [Pyrinomonadaceae bacterium]|nr:DNA repair protein RecO [Pyrinomonadaceae bacterium]
MPLVETESLVLKSYNLAEADRIVVFLTRDHGVVRGVAKGAKRLTSRFGSTLEPFSKVNLEYFQKEERELVTIQTVELIRSCFETASDPAFLRTFSYIADLLISFAPPHDPNEKLYRMVSACIDAEPNSPDSLGSIRLYFEVWLLRLGGYLPDWTRCDNCHRQLDAGEEANLKADFALLCGNCRRAAGAQKITPMYRDLFTTVQKLSPEKFIEFSSAHAEAATEISDVLKRIISTVIGREVAGEKTFAVNF